MRSSLIVTALLIALAGLVSCADEPVPAKQQIRMLNDQAEAAALERDISALQDMVAENYLDELGKNKQSIVRIAQVYLLRNRSIHLLSMEKSLEIIDGDNATAEILVAMAGEPISAAEQLFNMRADLVWFDVRYVRSGSDWKVSGLRWRKASTDDLF